jgi:hypothetical protein
VDDGLGDGQSVVMDFLESLGSNFLANLLAGILIAGIAAFIAVKVTDKYTAKLEDKRARHQRDLAAAEELYRVYGLFFAAWKSWEYHSRPSDKRDPPPASPERLDQLISEAASAEGSYEAFVIRLSLEHELNVKDRAAMCCLRIALKQLRYAIRDEQPLTWWRSAPSPEYEAFKKLMPSVAGILVDTKGSNSWPTTDARTRAIAEITGNADAFRSYPEFSSANASPSRSGTRESKPTRDAADREVPYWVILSDLACRSDAPQPNPSEQGSYSSRAAQRQKSGDRRRQLG